MDVSVKCEYFVIKENYSTHLQETICEVTARKIFLKADSATASCVHGRTEWQIRRRLESERKTGGVDK